MANEVLTKFIERLTSNYTKQPGSNVYALLEASAKHIQENEDLLNLIGQWRDIDQAQGATLDRIGGNVQQMRGRAPDEVYRVMIKSKIRRNLSNGSINTLIDFLSFILQIPKTTVKIIESWSTENRHAVIKVDVPAASVDKTGLSMNQFGTLLNLVIVAGVKAEVLFKGTFSFSSQDSVVEVDSQAGFADIAQTTGGELGAYYDPKEDYELPI